jgi:hypothetical protein
LALGRPGERAAEHVRIRVLAEIVVGSQLDRFYGAIDIGTA